MIRSSLSTRSPTTPLLHPLLRPLLRLPSQLYPLSSLSLVLLTHERERDRGHVNVAAGCGTRARCGLVLPCSGVLCLARFSSLHARAASCAILLTLSFIWKDLGLSEVLPCLVSVLLTLTQESPGFFVRIRSRAACWCCVMCVSTDSGHRKVLAQVCPAPPVLFARYVT